MSRSRWIIFAIIAIATLGGLVFFSSKDKVDVSSVDPQAVIFEGDNADNMYGNKDAKVILIEYADFQCPGCANAAPQIRALKETYKDSVLFVFRHFPLTTIHPNALIAGYTAQAAALQGKFWEMHDVLFENQTSWAQLSPTDRTERFRQYAGQISLDLARFDSDLSSARVAGKVAFDRALGGKANVESTPTIFVNNEKMSSEVISDLGQQNGALLAEKLNSAIIASGGTPPKAQQ